MAEVVQTCTLLVTGRLEEVLDPVQQSRKYPAVQLDRLSAVLTKFRCVLMHLCNIQWSVKQHLVDTAASCWRRAQFITMLLIAVAQFLLHARGVQRYSIIFKTIPQPPGTVFVMTSAQMSPIAAHSLHACAYIHATMRACTINAAYCRALSNFDREGLVGDMCCMHQGSAVLCREIGDKASSSGHHLFGNSRQPAVSSAAVTFVTCWLPL